jgi:hypothetical protein
MRERNGLVAARTEKVVSPFKTIHNKPPMMGYHSPMKKPPDNPEFARFTAAMRKIMKVSKVELQRRMEAEKKGKRFKTSASPSVASSSTQAG